MAPKSEEQPLTYRNAVGVVIERARSYAWIIVLPAAAECTASIWFPDISLGSLDLQLAALNVTGALMEGFFWAFLNGAAVPKGPIGDSIAWLADDICGSFLSTYTSWAGMVGFAASLAYSQSVPHGLMYMVACIICGFFAHVLGHTAAVVVFGSGPDGRKHKFRFGVSLAHHALLGAIGAYIGYSYYMVRSDVVAFEDADILIDSDLPALFRALDSDDNRFIIACVSSIAGAATGNALGNYVGMHLTPDFAVVKRGTLCCNTFFALLGLILNVATLRHARWRRSVLLQSFAGSFCGAASAFAGHASDSYSLYRELGVGQALRNTLANFAGAMLVFLVAYELERLLPLAPTLDVNADGVVALDEIGAHYGLLEATRACKPPMRLLGLIPLGAARC